MNAKLRNGGNAYWVLSIYIQYYFQWPWWYLKVTAALNGSKSCWPSVIIHLKAVEITVVHRLGQLNMPLLLMTVWLVVCADRAIRHRACSLRDMAQALLKAELDPEFERLCHEITQSRKLRGKCLYHRESNQNAHGVRHSVEIIQAHFHVLYKTNSVCRSRQKLT